MAFPVFNTFIEFRVQQPTRRCRSAPPAVLVTVVDAKRKRQRRRRASPEDDQTLWQFRRQAFHEKWQWIAQRILSKSRCDRWGLLAHRVLAVHLAEKRTDISLTMVAVASALRRTLQVMLPTRLFVHVAHSLEIWHECAKYLCQGILQRMDGNHMQIWASRSEMRSEKIKRLVLHASYVTSLFARCDIALRLPITSGHVWSTMRLDREMPIESVRAVAAVSLGRPSRTLRLTHLNSELICGTLGSNDVLPGSCLIVEFRE